jgi:hypothetical protein
MIPRMWDGDSLIRFIPWMKLQNLQDCNILCGWPQGEYDLNMVDDLKHDSLNRMSTSGVKLALVCAGGVAPDIHPRPGQIPSLSLRIHKIATLPPVRIRPPGALPHKR